MAEVRGEVGASAVLRQAWDGYVAALDEARRAVEGSEQFRDAPEQRGVGFRLLCEAQAMAYNFAVAPSTDAPRIYKASSWQTDVYTLGGNNSDFSYGITFLDGRERYRLTGNVNDSRLLLAQLNSALAGSPGGRTLANYDFSDFAIGEDGSLDIIISADRQEGNWIELDPVATYQWLMFRPSLHGWDQSAASLSIERLGAPCVPPNELMSEAAVAARIEAAAGFLRYIVRDLTIGYGTHVLHKAGGVNRLVTIGADEAGEVGSPSARYINGVFAIEPEEALIIEIREMFDGPYWNVQLFDVWLRSLEFTSHQSSLHGDQLVADPDGVIRVVIALNDPGVANWLDTTGLRRGQMLVRVYRAPWTSDPVVRKVRLDELTQALPAGTVRVTPEQRSAELARRRAAFRRWQGE